MASTVAFDPDAGSFDAWLDAVAAAGPPELWGPDPEAAALLDERLAAELDLLDVLESGGAAGLVARVADTEVPVPLGPVVGLLAGVDPDRLDGAGRVDLIRAWERVAAMVAGCQQRALAAVVEATEGCGLAGEDARHEVGAALRLAPGTAAVRTRAARVLADRLTDTLAALQTGVIGYGQAAAIAAGVDGLPDQVAQMVQARVLARAGRQTVAETRRAVRDAVEAVDPASAAERHQRATAARTVERMAQRDGMESLWATMPASVARDVWDALTATARTAQQVRDRLGLDRPGLDALRVDALVDAVLHTGGADPDQPTITVQATTEDADTEDAVAGEGADQASRRVPRCRCGGAQTAAVVIDLATLLGLRDDPGRVPGYGAVPAPVARALAADRDWVRWLVDPDTGALLDVGADRYRPGDRLRRFIAARDRVCGFPGCNRPAAGCDCDHVVAFAHHGRTIRVNLGPLCRQHHNAKTHGLWRLHYQPDTGIKTWTSPLGKTYQVSTDPILT